jgi:LPXTG-site transpeptidase (sortase) family protein
MRRRKPSIIILFGCFLSISIILDILLPTPAVEASQAGSSAFQVETLSPEINKKFLPVNIPPGGVSRLTIYSYNPNEFVLQNVRWTDNMPAAITVADEPLIASDCEGMVTADPGSSTISLTGGSVPAKENEVNGECFVAVNVTSFSPGNHTNILPIGALEGEYIPPQGEPITLESSSAVQETLNVAQLVNPTLGKRFSPDLAWENQRSRLRITIRNNDTRYSLNQVSLTDTLPPNLVINDPAVPITSPSCGDSVLLTALPGESIVTIEDAVIPPSSACLVDVYVTAASSGSYTNELPAEALITYEGVTNQSPREDTLTVRGLEITKQFSEDSFLAGEEEVDLTITIRNPLPQALTNAALVDDLTGEELRFIPGSLSTTCETTDSSAVLTLSENDQKLTLSSATIPAGTNNDGIVTPNQCIITAKVTAPGNAAGGLAENQISEGALDTEQGITNTNLADDSINIEPQSIGVTKSFDPPRFELGETTTVVIRLSNPTSTPIPNVTLTDDLPEGLTPLVPAQIQNSCEGALTVESNAITLSNGTIPANGFCEFEVGVTTTTGATAGELTNTIPARAITGAGITNLTGESEDIEVYPEDLGVRATKTYDDDNRRQPTGSEILMTLTFTAPEDQDLTDVEVRDNLPAGLTISTSAPSTSGCGGSSTLTATPTQATITLEGGAIAAGQTCSINVYVSGALPGDYLNVVSPDDFISHQGQTFPSPIQDTLRLSDYRIEKSFSQTKINRGGKSILTIRLINENPLPMEDLWLRDRLATMGSGEFLIAADPAPSTTCGGDLTADPDTGTIELTGGTIPGKSGSTNGLCLVTVTIYATQSANTSTNRIADTDSTAVLQGTGTPVPPRSTGSAQLTVADMKLDVVKSFDPSSVSGGGISRMSILLINPNDVPLSEIAFIDNMPEGMKLTQPFEIDTSTCGGEVVVASDRMSFSYSGGYLAAGRRCTISLNATIRINGNRFNTIPAGAVTTFIGVTNKDEASSTLTNLPGVSVKKYFSPDRILGEPGEYSLLTITLTNTSNAPVENMGLLDTFPDGLLVADIDGVSPSSSCGGSLTANPNESEIELAGGALSGLNDPDDDRPEECELIIPVFGTEIKSYRNVIAKGTVTAEDPNVTNAYPAEDTLVVYGTPDMQIVKSVTSSGPYVQGNDITYEIIVTNSGDITLENVQVTDVGVSAELGGCVPDLGASLAPGASMVCEASHTVTADDFGEGEYANTAIATSDQTDPVNDDEVVPLEGDRAMSVKKTVTSLGPYEVGSFIEYLITVRNIGELDLEHLSVSEITPGVNLGSCVLQGEVDPVSLPMTLSPGEVLECAASYQVTQTDVDAGSFTNTAQADCDQLDPQEDSVSTNIFRSPAMSVYKYETSTGTYEVGDQISFDIVVQNTGSTTLTNVQVTDTGTELPLGVCTLNEDPTPVALPATLQVDDILYCKAYHDVSQPDIDAGLYENTAVVTSAETDPQSGSAEVELLQLPFIDVIKSGIVNPDVVEPDGVVNAGDWITYEFTIKNTGNVTLSSIGLTDLVGGVEILGSPIDSLSPNEADSTSLTGRYTLKQADIDAGTFTNMVEVTALDTNGRSVSDEDSDTQNFSASPGILLEKTGQVDQTVDPPDDRPDVGDRIDYTFTVTNIGNVTLDNFVFDDVVEAVTFSGSINSLPPGESDSVTGSYLLSKEDLNAGSFTNTASVTANTPDDSEITGHDGDTQVLPPDPSILLTKTGVVNDGVVDPPGVINPGDLIEYQFEVENTGNVTLRDISITDDVGSVTLENNLISELDPGTSDSTTITGTYEITQEDIDAGSFTNTAEVFGTDINDTQVSDPDTYEQTLTPTPELSLEKRGTVQADVVLPEGEVNVGDQITYDFIITNTGNVTLTEVDITDENSAVDLTGAALSSLAPGQSDSSFRGVYTLTQEDIDAGKFINTATVSGNMPNDDEVTDVGEDEQSFEPVPGIQLAKTSSLIQDEVLPDNGMNAGDQIQYSFKITNTGNVTLYDILVTDSNPEVTLSGCEIDSLSPGDVDEESCSGIYVVTQADIDSGKVMNQAAVVASDPFETEVGDEADNETSLIQTGVLGVAKALKKEPMEINPGIWRVIFVIDVANLGNVTLHDLQVVDDLSLVFKPPNSFTLIEITSEDFDLNTDSYDGLPEPQGDPKLLKDGLNGLEVGESGKIEIHLNILPMNGGPFENTAQASALDPADQLVEDNSQSGLDPDPDGDDDPKNNEDPTPVDFGKDLFKLPLGIKTFDNAGQPILEWTVTWINHQNIVPIKARMSDPIPEGSVFANNGESSGYPLPSMKLPAGSTASGVQCKLNEKTENPETVTDYCYFEGPSSEYPRGRIVWEGILGADLDQVTPETAENEIQITYATRVNSNVKEVTNQAHLDWDQDGDGQIETTEQETILVSSKWYVESLPETGLTSNQTANILPQPEEKSYQRIGMNLVIPKLSLQVEILTVPFADGSWDVTWLGAQAGYLEGSAYPTWAGNTILTAHASTPQNTWGIFSEIHTLSYGDIILIRSYGMTYTYEVRSQSLIRAGDLQSAFREEDYDWVTLMTCEGYDPQADSFAFRRIVRAVLIAVD